MSSYERGLIKSEIDSNKSKSSELPDENAEILKEMDEFEKNYIEKEKRENAFFSLGIDKTHIDKEIEEAQHERDKELLQLFRCLPEKLEFQPGKTLIVGENGSGKSTLAKALFLALKKVRQAESLRLHSLESNRKEVAKRIKSFNEADQDAEELVYEPSLRSHQAFWLKSAGLAPDLGRAFKVKDFTSDSSVGMEYADFHEIIGKIKALNEDEFADEATGRSRQQRIEGELLRNPGKNVYDLDVESLNVSDVLDEIGERNRNRGSARQTVEGKATDLIHGDYEENGPGIYFLDEPESGISPMRHNKIVENIDNMVHIDKHNGSIIIIPTNSIKLYESDLPRIDLRYPERGIFRPSQFPDYFED